LSIDDGCHILDVGCGIAGSSRFASETYGCRVTGIDLTEDYINTGNALNRYLGFDEKVRVQTASATALKCTDASYDGAYMLHVGMNIEDKKLLATEIFRVLRAGAKFGIYDVMRVGKGEIVFPVPWAEEASGSSVDSLDTYRMALEQAGFQIVSERNRRDFALNFFKQLMAGAAKASGPPALGLHILMGDSAPIKVENMAEIISRRIVAPIEIVAEKS